MTNPVGPFHCWSPVFAVKVMPFETDVEPFAEARSVKPACCRPAKL